MFEIAETGQKIDKETYEALLPNLRSDLVAMQQRLRGANFPVLIVYAGVNGAGKVMTMNLMSETLDPRWILSRAYDEPSDEERARPEYWRFWRDLPPHGAIGQYLRSWYSRPLLDHVYGRTHDADFDASLARARAFEKVLADDGALILKYWMHLSEKAQKKRLTALESDPHESWRVSEIDWQHWRMYDRFIASAERLITSTDTEYAPWRIIEGADARYRSATVMTSLLNSVNRHIDQRDARKKTRYVPVAPTAKAPVILQKLRHDLTLNKPDYSESLQHRWARLNPLTREATKKGISVIMVFEGWDAAGKGGCIRRLTGAMDARYYSIYPICAPSDEENQHHYLWRFWRRLGRDGRVTIFDRSWYGRVMVERVEGFCTSEEWQRAYGEINDFEAQLADDDIILIKYWLNISAAEQLRRFEAREQTPFKRWKLTDEDWRNRDKWDVYEQAVNDMIDKTDTRAAPWTLVEADCKRYARIKVIDTFCTRLEERLGR